MGGKQIEGKRDTNFTNYDEFYRSLHELRSPPRMKNERQQKPDQRGFTATRWTDNGAGRACGKRGT